MQVRAIVGSRVSVWDDESQTSPSTQLAAGEEWAMDSGMIVVGTFSDLDVSASVSPWERPDLGPWLGERSHEWDAIIFSKVDRAFRSVFDCADVARWAEKNHKMIVFAADKLVMDFRDGDSIGNQIAKAMLTMMSLFAEMELNRIKSRFRDAHAYLRNTKRWAGGPPPFGYMVVPDPKAGKVLEIDPVSSEYVRMMADLIIQGKSQWEVAEILIAKGIPTPTAYHRSKEGVKVKNPSKPIGPWNQAKVGQILRNKACVGVKMTGHGTSARPVRDADGLPIQAADPIFTDEEWTLLRGVMEKRAAAKERKAGASDLLGVAICGGCGDRLYRSPTNVNGKTYVYSRCLPKAGKPACKGYSFKEEFLMKVLDDQAPSALATIPEKRRVFRPGEDHTRELERVVRNMDGIRNEKRIGAYDYQGGQADYDASLLSLVAQRQILEKLPQRSDEWVNEPTGKTLADAYMEADRPARRILLMENNITLLCHPVTGDGVTIRVRTTDAPVLTAV